MRNRALVLAALLATLAVGAIPAHANPSQPTSTPIKHLVVIFQENVSFDHYFGTYPNAANPAGEPSFTPLHRTPSVNGLNEDLLSMNPNLTNPFRLDRSQELICDQDHDYTPEQQAFDGGLMDSFVAVHRWLRGKKPDDGLLRRQHRHRAVELRAALCDERQLV